jgi:hypothetical protein
VKPELEATFLWWVFSDCTKLRLSGIRNRVRRGTYNKIKGDNVLESILRRVLALACLFFLAACGGGGSGGQDRQPVPNTPAPEASYVRLTSDVGDYIGLGRTYSYTQADARITITSDGPFLKIYVEGNEKWGGYFQLPYPYTQLEPGSYFDLETYPGGDNTIGTLSWSVDGRDCSPLSGWVIIDSVTYDDSTLTGFDLSFEQQCEGSAPAALRGEIHWYAGDPTMPQGPEIPPPADLWEPASGIQWVQGNYVYLDSQSGDFIGLGGNYVYTSYDSQISISAANGLLTISVDGIQNWSGDFHVMSTLSALELGYYGDLRRVPFHNPAKGGLSWSGEHRSCNTVTGWFVVDSVTYDGSELASFDLRFEQYCDESTQALRGAIHWDVDNIGAPPVVDPPTGAGVWQPPPGATPAEGNYVYLDIEASYRSDQPETFLYTSVDSEISADVLGNSVSIAVAGDENWDGTFHDAGSSALLEVGVYEGGFNWGHNCNTVTGWFAIDSVAYDGPTLTAIDMRFEQHCEGRLPTMRGAIHWDANDPTVPPGPVQPPPSGLWAPAPGVTPATDDFVYLESEPGDDVGLGGSYLYSQANAQITMTASGALATVHVDGDKVWHGAFEGMSFQTRLEPGYYGDLQRYPFHNETKGGMDWSGDGRGCNTLSGWFVVDSVTYDGSVLTALELRFEQRCDGSEAALHGAIRLHFEDTRAPPGPIEPPPGLWDVAPGITPATGNYVYLDSEPGDYVGDGATYLHTPQNSEFYVADINPKFEITIVSDVRWDGEFQGPETLSRLEPGYYGDLVRHSARDPARGGFDWNGRGNGCNTLTGWFVVDSVTYVGGSLQAIDLRFEQHCEGAAPALHGKIHWVR